MVVEIKILECLDRNVNQDGQLNTFVKLLHRVQKTFDIYNTPSIKKTKRAGIKYNFFQGCAAVHLKHPSNYCVRGIR